LALPKQSSGSVQGGADKDPNSSEKFILNKKCRLWPKGCQNSKNNVQY